jgi:hypothetical protein
MAVISPARSKQSRGSAGMRAAETKDPIDLACLITELKVHKSQGKQAGVWGSVDLRTKRGSFAQ